MVDHCMAIKRFGLPVFCLSLRGPIPSTVAKRGPFGCFIKPRVQVLKTPIRLGKKVSLFLRIEKVITLPPPTEASRSCGSGTVQELDSKTSVFFRRSLCAAWGMHPHMKKVTECCSNFLTFNPLHCQKYSTELTPSSFFLLQVILENNMKQTQNPA